MNDDRAGTTMLLSRRKRCHVGAANYEIRIKGRVSDSLLSAFEGLAVTTEPVETVVYYISGISLSCQPNACW